MNTIYIDNNSGRIQLNETFMRLVTGVASLGEIVAERRAVRAAQLAREDAYTRRHREYAEASDMLALSYSH